MKMVVASIVTAMAASVCCIGPVVAVTVGAGALGAASIQFQPYRPMLLTLTVAFVGLAFYRVYRPTAYCTPGSTCGSASQTRAKVMLWIAAAVVVILVTLPYYVEFVL